MRTSSVVILILLALGAGAAGGYFLHQMPGSPAPMPAAQPTPAPPRATAPAVVETVVLEEKAIQDRLNAVGTLVSEESVTVRPEIAGRISEIHFHEGQNVRKGDLLLRLDDAIAKAELQQAQANYALANSKFQRSSELQRQGFISRQGQDEARNAVQVARADVALAQARLEKTRIVVPFDGKIGLRNVSVGDYITTGQDLVTLEAIDTLKVDFRTPEIFLAQIHTGQQLNILFDALPERHWQGEVTAISPLVDKDGRAIVMRARIDNADGVLRPGMFARVDLLLNEQRALMVPEGALLPREGLQYVFRIVDNVAEEIPVQVGLRREGLVEISGDLAIGDTIVAAGAQKIRNGSRVTVSNPQT